MLASQQVATQDQSYSPTLKAVPNENSLIGAHLIHKESGEPQALLVFSREGAFYMAQLTEEKGFNALLGYGIGTYSQLNNSVHFSVSHYTDDTSSPQSSADHPAPVACSSSASAPYVLKIVGSSSFTTIFETNGAPHETFSARRVPKDHSEMAGSWKLDSHDLVIVFDGDDTAGDYYLIEFGRSALESKWVETGTYRCSGNVINPVPFAGARHDGDCKDIDGSFIIEVNGNSMTFIIEAPDGIDEVTLTRID